MLKSLLEPGTTKFKLGHLCFHDAQDNGVLVPFETVKLRPPTAADMHQ
jgi:hypothetical protein